MDIDTPPPPPTDTDTDTPVEEEKEESKEAEPSKKEEEGGAAEYPDMKLAQDVHKLAHIYTTSTTSSSNKEEASDTMGITNLDEFTTNILTKITQMKNPTYMTQIQTLISLPSSHPLYQSPSQLETLKTENKLYLESLEQKVKDQKEAAGDMEVLDARLAFAKYSAMSGSKEEALEGYELVLKLPKLSSGKIMDALMECVRICSFYGDLKGTSTYMEKIDKLADQNGDWDRRNRLKIYQSLLTNIPKRQIKESSSLLIDCIATFSCNEVCTYTEFIQYCMLTNVLHLPRVELKKKILDGPEILSVAKEIPQAKRLVETLYECDYVGYLESIVDISPILLADRYLAPHAGYLLREYHVLGYQQFLDAYKSVTLASMASTFGITEEYLDTQLSRFIAAGRLTAKIDKYGGVVETRRPDAKNKEYRECIQKGDLLLNRIQKLARVVDL